MGPEVTSGRSLVVGDYLRLLEHGFCGPTEIDDRVGLAPSEEQLAWLDALTREAARDGLPVDSSLENVFGTFVFFRAVLLRRDGSGFVWNYALDGRDRSDSFTRTVEAHWGPELWRARERVVAEIRQLEAQGEEPRRGRVRWLIENIAAGGEYWVDLADEHLLRQVQRRAERKALKLFFDRVDDVGYFIKRA